MPNKLLAAILQDLSQVPAGYLQPKAALCASVRLLMVPPPSDADIDQELLRAEADGYVVRQTSPIQGAIYGITPLGRTLL